MSDSRVDAVSLEADFIRSGLALEDDLDLRPDLELARPRDRLFSAVLAPTRPLGLKGYYYRSLLLD